MIREEIEGLQAAFLAGRKFPAHYRFRPRFMRVRTKHEAERLGPQRNRPAGQDLANSVTFCV